MTKTTNPAKVGDVLTLLGSLTLPTGTEYGDVFPRGTVVEVTPELIERTKDRNGESWLDDLSEQAQTARWGSVRVAMGDQSETVNIWNDPSDTATRGLLREQELEEARTISNPAERRETIAAINGKYGAAMTSHVIASYGPDAPGKYGPEKRS